MNYTDLEQANKKIFLLEKELKDAKAKLYEINLLYDYNKAVFDDVLQYIIENEDCLADFQTIHDYKEHLYDDLWNNDNVTGNASGSYTYNKWIAEIYIAHNFDLIADVIDIFGLPEKENGKPDFNKICDAEFWDVAIRCKLLSETIYNVTQTPDFLKLWHKYHKE